jgi:hypothetical protein
MPPVRGTTPVCSRRPPGTSTIFHRRPRRAAKGVTAKERQKATAKTRRKVIG